MADSTIVFAVLAVVVVLFVTNRVPVDIVAVGTALTLWATGVLGIDAALAGFGDPTVVYIASLFVVSEALDATGVTTWAGQQLVPPRRSESSAAARADDVGVRRPDGADQRERGRRRALAGRGRHRGAHATAASRLLMPLASRRTPVRCWRSRDRR